MLRPRRLLALLALPAALAGLLPGSTLADSTGDAGQSVVPSAKEWMKQIMDLPADNVRAALDQEDRPAADRKRDGEEKIEAVLRASGISRDMRVFDLRAADGYLAQVLVQAVRRQGKVWANNDPSSIDKTTAKAWSIRLEEPSTADIARVDSPLASPIPAYATPVDIVFSVNAYHDSVARGIDRKAMNRAVFAALLPGGRYVVVDARGDAGASAEAASRLCRVSEAMVQREIEAAGFRLLDSSDALKDAGDSATASACRQHAKPADRILLVFQKPPA